MKEEKFEVFNFKWEGKHETSHSTHKPQIGGKVALKVQLVKRMHLQLPHTVLHGGKLSVQSLTLPYKTNKLCLLSQYTDNTSLPPSHNPITKPKKNIRNQQNSIR
jgi:Ser-tRNA(Ala) deacylase AlaX